jgi:hypothetical protein
MFVFQHQHAFHTGLRWSLYCHYNFPINTTLLRSEAATSGYNQTNALVIVDKNSTVMGLLHQEHRVYSTVQIQTWAP